MARIRLEHVTKKYGKITALEDVSIDVQDNEFYVIFGPAGAGKTSVLNLIAGIADPEEGNIRFDDTNMNYVEPRERDVAMVFENYALYPHKTVYENIASSMRTKKHRQPETVVDREVKRVAKLMNISELLERRPAQASNGQRQRIALGRALVRNPNVFLMDEPLAHLDAKLRNSMRKELKSMQEAFHTTTIYVTHDYTEAMSLGDRIAVIDQGKICQVGTGNEVYYLPKSEFVAKLFGDCEINILKGQVVEEEGKISIRLPYGQESYLVPEDIRDKLKSADVKQVDIGFRGWAIDYSRNPQEGFIKGSIYTHEPLGNKVELSVSLGDDMIRFIVHVDEKFEIDETVYLRFNMDKGIFFHSETKEYLVRHNEEIMRGGGENG